MLPVLQLLATVRCWASNPLSAGCSMLPAGTLAALQGPNLTAASPAAALPWACAKP